MAYDKLNPANTNMSLMSIGYGLEDLGRHTPHERIDYGSLYDAAVRNYVNADPSVRAELDKFYHATPWMNLQDDLLPFVSVGSERLFPEYGFYAAVRDALIRSELEKAGIDTRYLTNEMLDSVEGRLQHQLRMEGEPFERNNPRRKRYEEVIPRAASAVKTDPVPRFQIENPIFKEAYGPLIGADKPQYAPAGQGRDHHVMEYIKRNPKAAADAVLAADAFKLSKPSLNDRGYPFFSLSYGNFNNSQAGPLQASSFGTADPYQELYQLYEPMTDERFAEVAGMYPHAVNYNDAGLQPEQNQYGAKKTPAIVQSLGPKAEQGYLLNGGFTNGATYKPQSIAGALEGATNKGRLIPSSTSINQQVGPKSTFGRGGLYGKIGLITAALAALANTGLGAEPDAEEYLNPSKPNWYDNTIGDIMLGKKEFREGEGWDY